MCRSRAGRRRARGRPRLLPPRRANSAHPTIVPFQNFRTSDGWFVVGAAKPKFWQLLCGVLGTCLVHTYEIVAAGLGLPLERVEVRVSAANNDARLLGLETTDPALPWDITARVTVEAPGLSPEALAGLHATVRERCPLTNLLRAANAVTVEVA